MAHRLDLTYYHRQLLKIPTRKDAILDLVSVIYKKCSDTKTLRSHYVIILSSDPTFLQKAENLLAEPQKRKYATKKKKRKKFV